MSEVEERLLFGGAGKAEFDMDGPESVALVGSRFIPKEIRVFVNGGADEPDVHMKIEVRHGIPVCAAVMLHSRPEGLEIRDKDLRLVPISDWVEQIAAVCSYEATTGGIASTDGPTARAVNQRNVRAARSGRPRISRERLARVAEIYREHIDSRPTEAVRRAFGVKDRTAARYVEQARQAGLLPPTTPGKKKA